MVSKQHAHLMSLVGKMIPPLSPKLHKGQAGERLVDKAKRREAELVRQDWCSRGLRGVGINEPLHGKN
jgi:ATP-dependent NAD(P)H-hydrate dehydratase